MGYEYENKIQRLYDAAIGQITSTGEEWKKICQMMGQLYRYEFSNILMVYMQKPEASLVADYDTWKRVGRYVQRGSKGIAIFSSRALEPQVRYVFDISDTGGRNTELTWHLDKETMETYTAFLQDKENTRKNGKEEPAQSFLKAFTEEQIRVIMDSEFEERIAGLNQAAGKKQVKTGSSIQEITPLDALRCSVKYVVFQRCGFELTEEIQDFSFITAFQEEQEIYHLGSLTSDISCEVLRGISNDLLKIEERGIVYGENYNNIPQRGRRDVVSGSGITEGSRVNDGAWQVRSQGSTVPERELLQQVSGTGEVWETGRENAGSGRRGKPEDGNPGKQFSGKKQARKSRVHNGTVAVEAAGKDAGRGNRHGGNRTEIPLGQELFSEEDTENKRKAELELEIQQELKEIDASGSFSMQEGSPTQASFSFGADGQLSLPGQYPYKKTEQKLAVPQEYIRQVLLLGSKFSDGKKRIYNLFQQVSDTGERIRALKEEYGTGGSNWPLDGTGLHGYDTFYGKGIHFLWREEDGEKEGYVSWKGIERELSDLIMAGEYYQPPKQFSKEERKEETLWLLPLKDYFNHEIQYIAVKVLIYDIFTTNLDMEVKQEFLARIYGEKRDGFFMAEYADNSYGKCHITRDQEGITITYPEADGTKAEKRVDYSYCAYLVLHMIEENEYLSEGIFERFQEAPEAFTAMPWFMEIYHDYKERMKKELFFEAIQIESTEYVQSDRSGQNRTAIQETSSSVSARQELPQEVMNPELLEAVKLFLGECSAVVPYQPLLQMVFHSRLSRKEKISFLQRVISNAEENGESKAYHNNAYGFIEYTCFTGCMEVNYKTGNGERKKETVTYGQLFSVMEDVIKANSFPGTVQQAEYEEMYAKKSLDQKTPLEQELEQKLAALEQKRLARNYHFEDTLPKGGAKTRYQWNVEAVRLLKKIEQEERAATTEEQKILARFVGWGGLPQVFDENNKNWKQEYIQLKELFTGKEYEDARETVNTAFYTSPVISQAVYMALEQFGFQKGTVLEPALGTGHFFGTLPEQFAGSRLYGVEKDSISGRIAKLLYPQAEITIRGFEETQFPDNFFDVAIGNVPFGDFRVYDNRYAKYKFQIHDYFLAKALDKVRPGGIIAFITSKGTMDKANASVRRYLAERAELLGAVRLPNTAFRDSAGTDASSDILFLQKREQKTVAEPDWVHLGKTEQGIPVNAYFAEHPEMMLGTMEYDTRMFGKESRYTTCVNREKNFDLKTALEQTVKRLHGRMADIMELAGEEVQTEVLDADPDVKNYTYTFINGQLYYRENSKMYKKEMPAAAEERIRRMDEIRTVTRQLIFLQMEGCSKEELKAQQELLHDKYDGYVKKYGTLSGRGSRP